MVRQWSATPRFPIRIGVGPPYDILERSHIMAYIYKITNTINNKVYVGQTSLSVENRFKQHCKDSINPKTSDRPLYRAMRKYGIENFIIEIIEETDIPNEREKYWIEFYNSYCNGYNATLGGEGRITLPHADIVQAWKAGKYCNEIAKQFNYSSDQVSAILQGNGISKQDIMNKANKAGSIAVECVDIDTNESIFIYNSMHEAAIDMIELGFTKCKPGTGSTHISEVCRGKRLTFAGFKWKYYIS